MCIFVKNRARFLGCLILANFNLIACAQPHSTVPPLVTATRSIPITPTSSTWMTRWLGGAPCAPPCWEGITPGVTTMTEAAEILKKNPLIIDTQVITDDTFRYGDLRWKWSDGTVGGRGISYAKTSQHIIIFIQPSYPTRFRFHDVIAVYGEPSHVMASAGYPPDFGSPIGYSLLIFYKNKGLVFAGGYDVDNLGKPILSLDMSVGSPGFYEPTSSGFDAAFRVYAAAPKKLVEWQGFKGFDFYCRDSDALGEKPCR